MTAEEFRRIRALMGLTQVQLGERLGVTGGCVSRYESGSRPVHGSSAVLMKLFEKGAVKPDELPVS